MAEMMIRLSVDDRSALAQQTIKANPKPCSSDDFLALVSDYERRKMELITAEWEDEKLRQRYITAWSDMTMSNFEYDFLAYYHLWGRYIRQS